MKPFNLERALAGEPVMLRGGIKAYVFKDVTKLAEENSISEKYELRGGIITKLKTEIRNLSWTLEGKFLTEGESEFDIIGMWEEPRPQATITFSAPLKEIEQGQGVWYVRWDFDGRIDTRNFCFSSLYPLHNAMKENGLLFATKEDAAAFLAAMKQARA